MKKITPPKTEPIVEEIWSDERLDALHQVNMADSAITASARIILEKTLKKVDKQK
jgi:hypothetical protein